MRWLYGSIPAGMYPQTVLRSDVKRGRAWRFSLEVK